MTDYATRLHNAIQQKRTPVVVGLDPRFDQLLESIIKAAQLTGSESGTELKAIAFESFML